MLEAARRALFRSPCVFFVLSTAMDAEESGRARSRSYFLIYYSCCRSFDIN